MQIIIHSLCALSIAGIYYWYRFYLHQQRDKVRRLCERVTYMLWVAAERA